jgi:creatinine amidohydrolase/Fe(II)-dependent formamide hydrolase-like protein
VWSGYETLALNGFAYTLEFDRELVMALLRAYLEQLGRVGFWLVVVLTGHYGVKHVAALAEAADAFVRTDGGRDTAVWVLPEYALARDLGYHGDHAAKWETSILMHLRPELVDPGRLDDQTASEGIFGEDPRTTATRELGESVVDRVVANLAQRIEHFLGA